jgi:hypothetical protein
MLHGAEEKAQKEEWASRGWRRKAFWAPSWDKGPWFCSEECATNSHNAKQAQAYWEAEGQKEFETYCKCAAHGRGVRLFTTLVFALFATVLLGECIYARL